MLFFEAYLVLFALGAGSLTCLYYVDRPSDREPDAENGQKFWVSLNEAREAREREPYEVEYQEAA